MIFFSTTRRSKANAFQNPPLSAWWPESLLVYLSILFYRSPPASKSPWRGRFWTTKTCWLLTFLKNKTFHSSFVVLSSFKYSLRLLLEPSGKLHLIESCIYKLDAHPDFCLPWGPTLHKHTFLYINIRQNTELQLRFFFFTSGPSIKCLLFSS